MEITDEQVLTQLKTRKIRLKLELERVEIAIKAFQEIEEIDPLDELRFDDEIADDYAIELAMATLMYNPSATIEKKIQYVLTKLGQADAKQIAEYLLKIDRHIKDDALLFEGITYKASRMFKDGKLDAEKVGKKNVYKLKE